MAGAGAHEDEQAPLAPSLRALWAATHLLVWPARYLIVSLSLDRLAEAARLVGEAGGGFAALVVERDEVSLTIEEARWRQSKLSALREAGPYVALTLDIDLDLTVCGYLAPAAVRLAAAGVSIVPQCAFLKDHLLVHAEDGARARATLEQLIEECRQP